MNAVVPPVWLERLLLFLLPDRDRETISGDLCEEYRERKRQRLGQTRADLWYAWQVLTLAPRIRFRIAPLLTSRLTPLLAPLLRTLCVFTALCGCWLGAMDIVLRHPGVLAREVIAGTIVSQAVLTLTALHYRHSRLMAWAAFAGTVSIIWLAAKALIGTFRSAHLEGYVLLIALALIMQSILTVATLSPPGNKPRVRA